MSAPDPADRAVTPPGWYPDPKMVNTQRYWDGDRWTDNSAPMAPTPPVSMGTTSESWVLAGWIFAFLMPPVGLLIGLNNLGGRNKTNAYGIIFVSLIGCAIVATVLLDL